MNEFILHATSQAAWSTAQEEGDYQAESLEVQGFIHCSTGDQISRVVNLFFTGQNELVLLVIDAARLTSKLRWEPGADLATELFPHIYGPINLDSVVRTLELKLGKDGKFLLPEFLDFLDD